MIRKLYHLNSVQLRWWPASDNILTANDTLVPGKMTHGVIRGLERGVVYALRVLGYSAAGDGKKSPTVFFTLEGQVRINPETSELMNGYRPLFASPPVYPILLCFMLIGVIVD
ncbi:contactin [Plakobranchus ocellatus]|uniref:Contactin n=1 Tax=Plakobranchus ocellatus TaxID=259542 RepID=A0AAV3Z2W3_9GAST|nr:contactin [Plakobranchus ocellatus]